MRRSAASAELTRQVEKSTLAAYEPREPLHLPFAFPHSIHQFWSLKTHQMLTFSLFGAGLLWPATDLVGNSAAVESNDSVGPVAVGSKKYSG